MTDSKLGQVFLQHNTTTTLNPHQQPITTQLPYLQLTITILHQSLQHALLQITLPLQIISLKFHPPGQPPAPHHSTHPGGTHHARDRAATPGRDSPRAGQGRHTREGLTTRGTGPPHLGGTHHARDRAATPGRDTPHAGRELTRGHTSPSGPWVQLQKNVTHRNSAVQYLQGACRIPQSPICGDSAANSRQASVSPAALLNSAPRTSRSVHYGCRRFHSGNMCQVSNVWYR
jgi:hypothetical protein